MLIRPAGPDEMQLVRELFLEYAQSLGFSLCFQGFQQELDSLPGSYCPPRGALLLAEADGTAVGIVALRPMDSMTAEMKRLFIRPAYRGRNLGKALVLELIQIARMQGYQQLVLDTVSTMQSAQALYTQLGFKDIPAYYDNAEIQSRCMGLALSACDTNKTPLT